jgi:hypothetical protein
MRRTVLLTEIVAIVTSWGSSLASGVCCICGVIVVVTLKFLLFNTCCNNCISVLSVASLQYSATATSHLYLFFDIIIFSATGRKFRAAVRSVYLTQWCSLRIDGLLNITTNNSLSIFNVTISILKLFFSCAVFYAHYTEFGSVPGLLCVNKDYFTVTENKSKFFGLPRCKSLRRPF